MLYRVVVKDANNLEVKDYGLFDTKEEAERFKKIHVYELEGLEQIKIVPYTTKKVQEEGFVKVCINTFVRSSDNPQGDPFIETEDRLWSLDNIMEENDKDFDSEVSGIEGAIIIHDGSAPACSYNIVFPWPISDLLEAGNFAGVKNLKAKFFQMAEAILNKLIQEKPKPKLGEPIKLLIENFEEFKTNL